MVSFRTPENQCKGCSKPLPESVKPELNQHQSGNYYEAPVETYSRRDSRATRADDSDEKQDSPWQSFLYGLGLIGIAIFAYYYFDNWEQSGGVRRVNVILYALYSVLGKTGTAGVLGVAGVALMVSALFGGKSKQEYST
jgi:hypothetical protein